MARAERMGAIALLSSKASLRVGSGPAAPEG
jgi:hypothetical protein